MDSQAISAQNFRAAMGSFAAGVTVITTLDERGAPQAVTATAFSSVSLTPPLCLVCIAKQTRTYEPLRANGRFAVNILRAEQEWLSTRFASSLADRFASVPWQPGSVTGCPMIDGALVSMECQVVEVHSGGDHDIFLGSPVSIRVHHGAPLVYWRGAYSSLPPPPAADEQLDGSAATQH
ncbi:MAG TPA: flavin reductase family protein [Polyangiaceae bacterium]|nr:flavin reductase family protein [Polyangiaceae bacterium]